MTMEAAEQKRLLYSILFSAVFWLLFLLLVAFFPTRGPEDETEFLAVQIQLLPAGPRPAPANQGVSAAEADAGIPSLAQGTSSELNGPEIAGAAAAAVQPAAVPETPKVSPQPAPSAPAQTKPAAPVPKQEPKRAEPSPAAPKPVPKQEAILPEPSLAPDLTGDLQSLTRAASEQPQTRKPPAEWPDESAFNEYTTNGGGNTPAPKNTPAQPQTPAPSRSPQSDFSGSAGTVAAADTDAPAKATGSGRQQAEGTASSSTGSALGNIVRNYEAPGTGGGGISYNTGLTAGSSEKGVTGGESLAAVGSDGTKRRLLEPKEPVIRLSKESEALITATTHVMITLTVRPDGTVPFSGVSFSPSAVLPSGVQDEVRRILSGWRFDTGKSNGQAVFQYSITK